MNEDDSIPEPPEDFESLTSEEEEEIKRSFSQLEQRIEQLEQRDSDGYYALKNQKRLMYYLRELKRILEDKFGVEVPDPPSLETPADES